MKLVPYKLLFFLLAIGLFLSCSDTKKEDSITKTPLIVNTTTSTFYKGLDLSFQPELESFNVVYKDENSNPISVLPFVKQKGVTLIRLKLWFNPANGLNNLNAVKTFALRIKQNNMSFLLDIHYSDTWADPSNQTPPLAWQSLTLDQLKTQVYNYTTLVLTELKNQNTIPVFVQIGNETDSGFLWNYGKVWNSFNANWVNFAALFNKGSQAVREVCVTNTKIIFHHSSVENSIFFLNQLIAYPIDYDVIGLSYYPQFQTKDLELVQTKLNTLAATFNKEIMIVEVAYPFTLGYNDSLNNYVGSADQIIPNYPPTPQGQKDFILKIISILKNIPNSKGIGFVYWAPDWVSFSGNSVTSTNGSAWENQCLWDFSNKALITFDVFQ